MQVAAYASQQANFSLRFGGQDLLSYISQQTAAGQDVASNIQTSSEQAVTDITDVGQQLQDELLQAAQAMQQEFLENPFSIEDQVAAFQEEVVSLFSNLLETIQSNLSQGDLANLAGDIGGAQESFFVLQASLSIEVQITTQQTVPVAPDLTIEALNTVAQANVSRQDQGLLLNLISMMDELVRTDARDNLLRGVIDLVPLVERATPDSQRNDNALSVGEALQQYLSDRDSLRANATNTRQDTESGGSLSSAPSFAYDISMSFSYTRQTEIYFQTQA